MILAKWLIISGIFCLSTTLFYAQQPKAQPKQISSPAEYDSQLSNTFFKVEEWSYPWWIIENDDGTIEDTQGEIKDKKDAPLFKHTADCHTDHQGDHKIKFAEAKLIDENSIEILLHDESASTYDNLKITLKNGLFSCQYWTTYVDNRGNQGLIWTTRKQKLTLEKKKYQRGDLIKGAIEFECVEELTNSQYGGRSPQTIRIEGVFKPILN